MLARQSSRPRTARPPRAPLAVTLEWAGGDPVRREVHAARGRALDAALASLGDDRSFLANVVREELRANLAAESAADEASAAARHSLTDLHHSAVQAAREAVLAMRARDEIGDDAFHLVEEELYWLEMAGQRSDE